MRLLSWSFMREQGHNPLGPGQTRLCFPFRGQRKLCEESLEIGAKMELLRLAVRLTGVYGTVCVQCFLV